LSMNIVQEALDEMRMERKIQMVIDDINVE
jgi:hypothetical protein